MLDPMRKYAQSWGIKIVFGLIIIVFVFWGVGSFRGDKASVVATVDGQPVLIKDFEKAYQENLRLVKNKNPNVTDKDLQEGGFRWQVFSNMVTTRLLEAQAQKLGVSVGAEELRAEIAKIPAFTGKDKKFDPKRYEALLAANGVTPGEFEADFRQNLLLEKLAGYIGLPASVSESETRAIFDFMATGPADRCAAPLRAGLRRKDRSARGGLATRSVWEISQDRQFFLSTDHPVGMPPVRITM